MKSHELAKKLLSLPDKEVVIVTGVDGQYTIDKAIAGSGPWEDQMGSIRIQTMSQSIADDKSGRGEE